MNQIIEIVLTTLLIWMGISISLGILLSYFYEHKFFIAWYNFWIGIYYDRKKRIIYIISFPCVVFSFDRNKRKRKKKVKPEKKNIKKQVPKY